MRSCKPAVAGFTIVLSLSGAGPAVSQTMLPLDMIFAPTHPAATATINSATRGFNLSSAPIPTHFFQPPPDPVPAAAASPLPEPALPVARAVIVPQPPSKPPAPAQPSRALLSGTEPLEITPRPIARPTAEPAALSRIEPLSNRTIVERANAYFSGLTTLVANFTQAGGDGRRLNGTLYLQRPGKVRFQYDPPATLEVVADGSSVAVRDRKLATQDLYSIAQTPLKFLLREPVNLGQDIAIAGIAGDGDSVRLSLEDRSTLGGTSRIVLYFDPQVQTLTQWRIIDPQGFQTAVILNRTEKGRRLDPDLFRIGYEAILGGNDR